MYRSPRQPNIVYILAMTLATAMWLLRPAKIKTPNIDRLAQDGRTFTDAHACSAVCSPSRYGQRDPSPVHTGAAVQGTGSRAYGDYVQELIGRWRGSEHAR